jgi:hypothetical protein
VLSLPSKPWKKVKIEAVAEHRHRIVFLTEFADEAAFRGAVDEDIRPSLGVSDEVVRPTGRREASRWPRPTSPRSSATWSSPA